MVLLGYDNTSHSICKELALGTSTNDRLCNLLTVLLGLSEIGHAAFDKMQFFAINIENGSVGLCRFVECSRFL